MISVKISRRRGRLWQKWHDVPGQGRMSGYLPKMVTSFMNSPLPSWQPQHCQYSWKMATQSIFPRKIQTRRRQTCWIAVVLSGYRNILRNFRKVGMCIWHCLIIRVQEIYRPQYQCQKVKAQIGCKVNIFNLTQEEDWEKTWISLTKRKSLSVPFFIFFSYFVISNRPLFSFSPFPFPESTAKLRISIKPLIYPVVRNDLPVFKWRSPWLQYTWLPWVENNLSWHILQGRHVLHPEFHS